MAFTVKCNNSKFDMDLDLLEIQWWSLVVSVVFTLVGASEHFVQSICRAAKLQWLKGEKGDPEGCTW